MASLLKESNSQISSRLASLFNEAESSSGGKVASSTLRYVPPKQPKPGLRPDKISTEIQDSNKDAHSLTNPVLAAFKVETFQLKENIFNTLGASALCLLTGKLPNSCCTLLLYKNPKNPFTRVLIEPEFKLTVQAVDSFTFTDKLGNCWSIRTSAEQLQEIIRQITACRIKALVGSDVLAQPLTPESQDSSCRELRLGDWAEVSVVPLQFSSQGALKQSLEATAKRVRVQVTSKEQAVILASDASSYAWCGAGLLGATCGGKRLIIASSGPPKPSLACEVSVIKIKTSKASSAPEHDMLNTSASDHGNELKSFGFERANDESEEETSSSKAKVLSRIARVGHSVFGSSVPSAAVDVDSAVIHTNSEDACRGQSPAPNLSRSYSELVGHKARTAHDALTDLPSVALTSCAPATAIDATQTSHSLSCVSTQLPPLFPSCASTSHSLSSSPLVLSRATHSPFQPVLASGPPPENFILPHSYGPQSSHIYNNYPSLPSSYAHQETSVLSLLFSEARAQNTELRVEFARVADLVRDIQSKISYFPNLRNDDSALLKMLENNISRLNSQLTELTATFTSEDRDVASMLSSLKLQFQEMYSLLLSFPRSAACDHSELNASLRSLSSNILREHQPDLNTSALLAEIKDDIVKLKDKTDESVASVNSLRCEQHELQKSLSLFAGSDVDNLSRPALELLQQFHQFVGHKPDTSVEYNNLSLANTSGHKTDFIKDEEFNTFSLPPLEHLTKSEAPYDLDTFIQLKREYSVLKTECDRMSQELEQGEMLSSLSNSLHAKWMTMLTVTAFDEDLTCNIVQDCSSDPSWLCSYKALLRSSLRLEKTLQRNNKCGDVSCLGSCDLCRGHLKENLVQGCPELNLELEKLGSELETVKMEQKLLQKELDYNKAEKSRLKNELQSNEVRTDEVKAELETSKKCNTELKLKLECCQTENVRLEAELQKVSREREENLLKHSSELMKHEQNRMNMEKLRELYEEKLKKALEENLNIKQDSQDLRLQISKLQSDYDAAEAELETLRNKNVFQESRLHDNDKMVLTADKQEPLCKEGGYTATQTQTDFTSSLESGVSKTEVEASIKKVMNILYKTSKQKFVIGDSYDGAVVQSVLLPIIKEATFLHIANVSGPKQKCERPNVASDVVIKQPDDKRPSETSHTLSSVTSTGSTHSVDQCFSSSTSNANTKTRSTERNEATADDGSSANKVCSEDRNKSENSSLNHNYTNSYRDQLNRSKILDNSNEVTGGFPQTGCDPEIFECSGKENHDARNVKDLNRDSSPRARNCDDLDEVDGESSSGEYDISEGSASLGKSSSEHSQAPSTERDDSESFKKEPSHGSALYDKNSKHSDFMNVCDESKEFSGVKAVNREEDDLDAPDALHGGLQRDFLDVGYNSGANESVLAVQCSSLGNTGILSEKCDENYSEEDDNTVKFTRTESEAAQMVTNTAQSEPKAAPAEGDDPRLEPKTASAEAEAPQSDLKLALAESEAFQSEPKDASVKDEAPKSEPKAASVEVEAPQSEPKVASLEGEVLKSEAKAASAEVEAPKSEPKATSAEVEAPKSEPKAASVEVEAPQSEPKAASLEGEFPKSEAKATLAEVETPKSEPKAAQAEYGVPQAENETALTEDHTPLPESRAPQAGCEAAQAEGKTTKADFNASQPLAEAPQAEGRATKQQSQALSGVGNSFPPPLPLFSDDDSDDDWLG